jgi:phosphatidylglycerol---prolipoprotein diacylglyceryl transferase
MFNYPDISPIAFSIGTFEVRWYGIMYLLGFLGAYAYCVYHREWPKQPWSKELIADLLFYVAIGVIFGGTLGYWLFYEIEHLMSHPLVILKFWQPGRSFHGGLIGVIVAVLVFCYMHRRRFLDVMDFIAPSVPIGLGLGRLGNFLNAELWGRVTTMPWGMVFPHAGSEARHPSQLYEFFLEGVVLFLILHLYTRKQRPMGAVSGLFALCYGVFRFFVEFFREPTGDQGFLAFGWLTMGQALSLPLIVIGIALIWFAYRKK